MSTEADIPNRNAARSEATRDALVAAARELFAKRGYGGVGTEEIVRAAGVTRGALYHHFDGKSGLLEAVYEAVEADLTRRVAARANEMEAAGEGPIAAMGAAVTLFLEESTLPEVQQIVLLDAPSVLGWERWRAVADKYGLGLLEASLQEAIDAGEIRPQPVRPLAHVLMGALDEAALLVARTEDPAERAQVGEVLGTLLQSLRSSPPQT